MTRKEQLEKRYQDARAANGLSRPPRPRPSFGERLARGFDSLKQTFLWLFKACLVIALLGIVIAGLWFWWTSRGGNDTSIVAPVDGTGSGTTKAEVTPQQLRAFLTPSSAEALQLYGYVVQTPFVTENLRYREHLTDVDFLYVATNDTVNAFA